MRSQSSRTASPVDDVLLLHELFVRRQAIYDEAAVLRLTRTTRARLLRAIDESTIEPVNDGSVRGFAWDDVVQLVSQRWTPRMVAAALVNFVPYLNRTRVIPVELPIYQIRLLHQLAVSSGDASMPPRNVSDVLEREIHMHTVVESMADGEELVPGLANAAHFPLYEQRPQLVRDSCVYCASPSKSAGVACPSCLTLHERPWPRNAP